MMTKEHATLKERQAKYRDYFKWFVDHGKMGAYKPTGLNSFDMTISSADLYNTLDKHIEAIDDAIQNCKGKVDVYDVIQINTIIRELTDD